MYDVSFSGVKVDDDDDHLVFSFSFFSFSYSPHPTRFFVTIDFINANKKKNQLIRS